LQAFLILPVQRLPRYVLLLTELTKSTNSTHPGYAVLQRALSNVKDIADFVNEAKRVAENAQEILSIQESLTGKKYVPIMEPHRRYDSQGKVAYFSARKHYKPKPLQYYLFNDCVILCWPGLVIIKGGTQKFRVKEMAYLYNCEIEIKSEPPSIKNTFKLLCAGSEQYLLGFETPQATEEWLMHFKELKAKAGLRKEISKEAIPEFPSSLPPAKAENPEINEEEKKESKEKKSKKRIRS